MNADTVKTAFVLLGEHHAATVAATRAARAAAGQTRAADLAARWDQAEVESAIAVASALESQAAVLKGIAERQCNGHQTPRGDWDEAAAKRDEAKEARTETKVRALLAAYGVEPIFGGDPRGAVLKLATPYTGKANTLGGRESGWAV